MGVYTPEGGWDSARLYQHSLVSLITSKCTIERCKLGSLMAGKLYFCIFWTLLEFMEHLECSHLHSSHNGPVKPVLADCRPKRAMIGISRF